MTINGLLPGPFLTDRLRAGATEAGRKANRPVKLVLTREEVFRGTGPTCSTSMDIKIGAKRDGRILGRRAAVAGNSVAVIAVLRRLDLRVAAHGNIRANRRQDTME